MKKSLKQIQDHLKSLESYFGFNPLDYEQGTKEWHMMRLGVITASKAECVLAGKKTAKRQTYLNELIAEVATGLAHEVRAKPLEWGKTHEDSARTSYEFATGIIPHELPFIYKDEELRIGCSPDGYNDLRGSEIKCPYNSAVHIDFLCSDKIKSEYITQVQYSMWVTGLEQWDFACFDPRMNVMPISFKTLDRDEARMKEFSEKVPEFIEDMDKMLEKIGLSFGEHWDHLRVAREKKESVA